MGCATGYLKLSPEYNKGLWILTGYENWNYAYGIPEWIQWRAIGANRTFNRGIEGYWYESAFDDSFKPLEHFADKGGGQYWVEIVPWESWILSEEGVCVLTSSTLYAEEYVGY